MSDATSDFPIRMVTLGGSVKGAKSALNEEEAPPLRAKQDSITVVMVIEVNKEEATEGRGKNSSNCRFLSNGFLLRLGILSRAFSLLQRAP